MTHTNWEGFKAGAWQNEINVRDFIQTNYEEYRGDESFLAGATDRTSALMAKVQDLFRQERAKGGVLDIDTETVSSLTSYAPGYIDKDSELIVGMQTDAPSSAVSIPSAASAWPVRPVRPTATSSATRWSRSSPSAPPTTPVCSVCTPTRCVPPAAAM